MLRLVRDEGGGGERSEPERRLRLVGEPDSGSGEEHEQRPAPLHRRPPAPTYDDAA